MRTTVFDIETVALPESELPLFDESQVLVGNLKDPDKIKAKVDAARAEWLSGAALSPMTGRVAMVGFKEVGAGIHLDWNDNESELVGNALQFIAEDLAGGNIIAGFNCYSFDLPFLARRAWKHGLKLPMGLRFGRYWSKDIIDLREEWLMGDRSPAKGTTGLDAIARFLGLPQKLGSGADFAGLDLEQRKAYLTRDLEVTEALWLRIH
jgi:DNA polymerase elongation subunit (family B)